MLQVDQPAIPGGLLLLPQRVRLLALVFLRIFKNGNTNRNDELHKVILCILEITMSIYQNNIKSFLLQRIIKIYRALHKNNVYNWNCLKHAHRSLLLPWMALAAFQFVLAISVIGKY